ncbi:hypothetical protein [Streptomyces flaveolus]|uniref:hypothetical protein n=1 Tax=Streptomyces flaveolus TaxID=67297 RepID=UPI0036F7368F
MPKVAADEAIEVFDLVRGDLIRASSTKMTKHPLRTLKDLDAAAIQLRTAWTLTGPSRLSGAARVRARSCPAGCRWCRRRHA